MEQDLIREYSKVGLKKCGGLEQRFDMTDVNDATLRSRLMQNLQARRELQDYVSAKFSEETLLRKLLTAVDDSVFGAADWVEAQFLLSEWLDERGLDLSAEDQINYVGCVAEAGAAGMGMEDLSSLMREMLATYGCERAIKKS